MKGKFIYLDKAEEAPLHMVLKPTKDGFVAFSLTMPEACGVGASKGEALNRAWSAIQVTIDRRSANHKRLSGMSARPRRARQEKTGVAMAAESEVFIVPRA